jgi:myo-inositol-1-phosphate synthase
MAQRRIGLWLIGACGSVAGATCLGLSAWARGLIPTTGMVTALEPFAPLDLDGPSSFVVGGHEVRQADLLTPVWELHQRSRVFDRAVIEACRGDLEQWSRHLRRGILYRPNAALQALRDRPDVLLARHPQEAIAAVQEDLRRFQDQEKLDQLIVVNAASTEPPVEWEVRQLGLSALQEALERKAELPLPASTLYAYAALEGGWPYVNLTPSLGASLPALEELARLRRVPHAGQDLKTGETLLKSVLAPLFVRRHLRVLSWVGHNILGNRDGWILNDPQNKASKVKSKEALLSSLLGYKPQSLVSIEYVESLDDWKTAWDHIHFEGFFGTKMTLQFTWQGCDSLLAAPLVLDLVRLVALAQRRGESGALPYLASFFKSPLATSLHDFTQQFALLEHWAAQQYPHPSAAATSANATSAARS